MKREWRYNAAWNRWFHASCCHYTFRTGGALRIYVYRCITLYVHCRYIVRAYTSCALTRCICVPMFANMCVSLWALVGVYVIRLYRWSWTPASGAEDGSHCRCFSARPLSMSGQCVRARACACLCARGCVLASPLYVLRVILASVSPRLFNLNQPLTRLAPNRLYNKYGHKKWWALEGGHWGTPLLLPSSAAVSSANRARSVAPTSPMYPFCVYVCMCILHTFTYVRAKEQYVQLDSPLPFPVLDNTSECSRPMPPYRPSVGVSHADDGWIRLQVRLPAGDQTCTTDTDGGSRSRCRRKP